MVGRVSLMLRGLGHAIHQPRRVSDLWIKYARIFMEEEEKRETMYGKEFEGSAKFEGGKKGMVFKRGKKGMGYYRDEAAGRSYAE